MKAGDAAAQAAEEAVTILSQRYGITNISVETMISYLARRPKFPDF
jgi:hypothetical protein